MRLSSVFWFAVGAVVLAACGEDVDPYGVPLQNASALQALHTTAGFTNDPCNPVPSLPSDFLGALPTCCGGKGHCVPEGASLGKNGDQLSSCEGGGKCAPDAVLQASTHPPKACNAGTGPGVCFPTCVDQIDRLKLLLQQDVCDPDERCAPCTTPAGDSTGLCDLGKQKNTAKPASCSTQKEAKPRAELCKSPPNVVDVTKLKACDAGHCIPKDAAGSMSDQLSPCDDAAYVCAPDKFIATGGLFTPKTCASINNAEGRCFSAAVGEVKSQGDRLPQDVCEAGEKCAPCFDPVSGEGLPSCTTPCDGGPTKPAMTFAKCGKDAGRCVPNSALGGGMLSLALKQDTCAKTEKCAPLGAIDRHATPNKCTPKGIFTSKDGEGVCMEAVFSGLVSSLGGLLGVSQANCTDEFLCIPCDLGDQPLPGCPAKPPAAKK